MMYPYPTIEEVEAATHYQLASWWRFLPGPGLSKLDKPKEFQAQLDSDVKIMDRIAERFKEFGGMTPEISKRLGW